MKNDFVRQLSALSLCCMFVLTGCANTAVTPIATPGGPVTASQVIKHVVVIFDENESFDHYFGAYPNAQNVSGKMVPLATGAVQEMSLTAVAGTPTPANYISAPSLLTANANCYNGGVVVSGGCNNLPCGAGGGTNPLRMAPSQAYGATESHSYIPEQTAFNNGAMDLFLMVSAQAT